MKRGLPTLKGSDGVATSALEKSEVLNGTFCSVFTADDGRTLVTTRRTQTSLSTVEILDEEVFARLSLLPSKTSCGPDGIPQIMLKHLAFDLAPPLGWLFRLCLATGRVPSQWKCAIVVPIFKSGDASCPCNYRPVSLTSTVCRLFEGFLKEAIEKHLESEHLISPAQHGFRKGHSTVTQLLQCVNDWTASLEKGLPTDVIYLDLKRAFDRVSHPKLLAKCRSYGLGGPLLSCIGDLLDNRHQSVKVDAVQSTPQRVLSGVPQGTVLSPILFSIFINDLGDDLSPGTVLKLFADDAKLYRPIASPLDSLVLQRDLDSLFQWADNGQMEFSPPKCAHLSIGPLRGRSYSMNGVQIESKGVQKDLGILVPADLRFSEHAASCAKAGMQKIGILFRKFDQLPPKAMVQLFRATILPQLEYGSQVWNVHLQADIGTLEKVQRNFTRRLLNQPPHWAPEESLTYEERLQRLGLTSLQERRLRLDLEMVYKVRNRLVPLEFDDFFLSASAPPIGLRSMDARHPMHLAIPSVVRSMARTASFPVRTLIHWNRLPSHILSAPSIQMFRYRLAIHTLSL